MTENRFRNAGIIGCGVMGSGIAEVMAIHGMDVIICEADQVRLEKGIDQIRLSIQKSISRGLITNSELDKALDRIKSTTRLQDLDHVDIIIEAVNEKMELKKQIFHDLEHICAPDTILASNTSSISITEIASITMTPGRVIGMHFFNPVPINPVVEVIPGILTDRRVIELVYTLASSLGKTPVLVKDHPGFLVNLLLIPFLLDAIRWYASGLASKEDMDKAIKLGLNHPMGPLKLADLIGLDTVMLIADSLILNLHDSRYSAPPLLRQMVSAGMLGRKTKKGFYEYD